MCFTLIQFLRFSAFLLERSENGMAEGRSGFRIAEVRPKDWIIGRFVGEASFQIGEEDQAGGRLVHGLDVIEYRTEIRAASAGGNEGPQVLAGDKICTLVGAGVAIYQYKLFRSAQIKDALKLREHIGDEPGHPGNGAGGVEGTHYGTE